MRLATMILPTADNDGASLRDVHAALSAQAIDTFGGFTAVASEGGWRDPATGKVHVEPGIQYQFATDNDTETKLESFARFYGHMAGQACVIVTHGNGAVVFVDCTVRAYA